MNSNTLWWTDWDYRDGVVSVRSTGQKLPVKGRFLWVCFNWFIYYLCMEAWRAGSIARRGPRVAFMPGRPRPWYFIWPALHAAGGRIVSDPEQADIVVYFEDATSACAHVQPEARLALNFACTDVTKSRVNSVFEQVFGYPLRIDPLTAAEPVVEKSETNGAHDGRIRQAPCEPVEGCVYQRLIDNRIDADRVEDFRCLVVGGKIPFGFLKRRPVDRRFMNFNCEVRLTENQDWLLPGELEKLEAFASAMSLDWGALDVLRDRNDGRIYVVDVNKTNIDPPIALPLRDKLSATRRVARMLRQMAGKPD